MRGVPCQNKKNDSISDEFILHRSFKLFFFSPSPLSASLLFALLIAQAYSGFKLLEKWRGNDHYFLSGADF